MKPIELYRTAEQLPEPGRRIVFGYDGGGCQIGTRLLRDAGLPWESSDWRSGEHLYNPPDYWGYVPGERPSEPPRGRVCSSCSDPLQPGEAHRDGLFRVLCDGCHQGSLG